MLDKTKRLVSSLVFYRRFVDYCFDRRRSTVCRCLCLASFWWHLNWSIWFRSLSRFIPNWTTILFHCHFSYLSFSLSLSFSKTTLSPERCKAIARDRRIQIEKRGRLRRGLQKDVMRRRKMHSIQAHQSMYSIEWNTSSSTFRRPTRRIRGDKKWSSNFYLWLIKMENPPTKSPFCFLFDKQRPSRRGSNWRTCSIEQQKRCEQQYICWSFNESMCFVQNRRQTDRRRWKLSERPSGILLPFRRAHVDNNCCPNNSKRATTTRRDRQRRKDTDNGLYDRVSSSCHVVDVVVVALLLLLLDAASNSRV